MRKIGATFEAYFTEERSVLVKKGEANATIDFVTFAPTSLCVLSRHSISHNKTVLYFELISILQKVVSDRQPFCNFDFYVNLREYTLIYQEL